MAWDVVGHGEKAGQVGGGQLAEEGVSGVVPFGVHPVCRGTTLRGECHQGGAPVGGVRATGHPAVGLKDVDEGGDVTRCAVQGLAELSLHHRLAVVVQHEQDLGARSALPVPSEHTDDGPSHGLALWTNADLDVDGVTIPAGDLVLLGLQQANDDQRRLGDRPGFDIARRPNPHLTFGHGPRFCLGAPLARLELQVLIGALLDRFPALALAVPVEQLQPRSTLLTGGLTRLPVTW